MRNSYRLSLKLVIRKLLGFLVEPSSSCAKAVCSVAQLARQRATIFCLHEYVMRSEKSEWAYEHNIVLQKRLVDAEIVWDSCLDQSSSRAGSGGGHLWEIVADEEDEMIGTPED